MNKFDVEWHWCDIWFRWRTVCWAYVKFDKSSTDSGELNTFPHQTKTAVPNWFRHRSFAVLNSSVRLSTCTWVEWHLNRALVTRLCSSVWGFPCLLSHFNDKSITNKYTIHVSHLPAIFHLFSTFECIFFRVHGLLFCGILPTCFSRR